MPDDISRSQRRIDHGTGNLEPDSGHHFPKFQPLPCVELFERGKVVGARGFEPPTPASRTRCATGLRYAPIKNSASC